MGLAGSVGALTGWRLASGLRTLGSDFPSSMNRIEIELTQWRVFFCGEAFAGENVSKMAVAVSAKDLGTVAVFVALTCDRAFDFVIKAWPTAMTIEFAIGFVQRSIAAAADVRPFSAYCPCIRRSKVARYLYRSAHGLLVR